MVDYLNNTFEGHIITIEDPIEFVHKSKKCLVNQRGTRCPHPVLRQRSEVGASRRPGSSSWWAKCGIWKTIQLALTAAETGHLVFGTLHTSSAPKTIDRIIDAFPPAQQAQIRTQLSEALEAVITQTLSEEKNRRTCRRARSHGRDDRGPESHSRGQVAPDSRDHAGQPERRHANDGHGAVRARDSWSRHKARSSVAQHESQSCLGPNERLGSRALERDNKGKVAMDVRSLLKVMVDQEASDLYLTVDGSRLPRPRLDPANRRAAVYQRTTRSPGVRADARSATWGIRRKNGNEPGALLQGARPFPCQYFSARGNVGLVFRHIKAEIQTVEQLRLASDRQRHRHDKAGLVLVVGATGSGKSTTLAAMIDHRNAVHPGHIVTVEDPIEFVHNHKRSLITQREVGFDTLSFQNALKNTLRQAPDVILIGEVRDTETMEAAYLSVRPKGSRPLEKRGTLIVFEAESTFRKSSLEF